MPTISLSNPTTLAGFSAAEVPPSADVVRPAQAMYTPLSMVAGGSAQSLLLSTGIRMPYVTTDMAVLLAQASLNLDDTATAMQKNEVRTANARLAAALASLGIDAIREEAEYSMAAAAAAEESLLMLESSEPLTPEQLLGRVRAHDEAIAALTGTVDRLTGILADPKGLSEDQIKALESELQSARTDLSQARQDRHGADMELAAMRIGNLNRQIGEVQGTLDLVPASNTEESARVAALLDGLRGRLAEAEAALRDYEATSDFSGRDEFSRTNRAAFAADLAALQQRVTDTNAHAEAIGLELEAIEFFSVSATQSGIAEFRGELGRSRSKGDQFDTGFELLFENMQEEIDKARGRALEVSRSADDALGAEERKQVLALAIGLAGAISQTVTTLADLEREALLDRPNRETSGPGDRLRLSA